MTGSRVLIGGVALALALGGGYWLGRDTQPASAPTPTVTAATPATSTPAPAPAPAPASADKTARRVLYYRNPMGLNDTSPVPKKDGMGMNYTPVYADDDSAANMAGTVALSPDRLQTLGVQTVVVTRKTLTRTVRTNGIVQVDESRVTVVAPKFEGYIQTLNVNTTGQTVKRGQALMEVYSPNLVLAQQDYLAANSYQKSLGEGASAEARESAHMLTDGALQRLKNWDISPDQMRRVERSGTASHTMTFAAPASGVVLDKPAIAGMRFSPGDTLFRIADLSNVWVIADVFEQDMAGVHEGQSASIVFTSLPGQTFTGKITFIYPTLSADTRTAKVRIELPNADMRLKPSLFATVAIATNPVDDNNAIAVPDSAVLDSGNRTVVLVDRGAGHFAPRSVQTGVHADGYTEIRSGLATGERVVTSASFLIDAESNLKAALETFEHK